MARRRGYSQRVRLITYSSRRGARAGAIAGDGVVDLWDAIGSPYSPGRGPTRVAAPSGMRALLETAGLDRIEAAVAGSEPAMSVADVELLPPVTDPQKIVCVGLNYRAHAEEAGMEPPEVPTFFAKFANALAAPGATVPLPAAGEKVDFEAEVAFVIARRAVGVGVVEALDHLAGYMLFNDLSARDLQFATPQWIPGKVFDGSAPCGPWLVSPDQAGAPDEIALALDLNGKRMQQSHTGDLIFGVAELVSHLSSLMTLEPGDIVATGTPAGVGSTRKPRVWLAPGDEVVVSSPTLGELRTTIG
jgi:2-keto-4-pentenoate hydratase/2-oxohepta-3-ene-1,7-dioic acid hydratase in catechol pathway